MEEEYDEFGSDDGLDFLPANTLAQLEQDALRSTQHNAQLRQSFGRQHTSAYPAQGNRQSVDGGERVRPPIEYGFDDEEIIELDDVRNDGGEDFGDLQSQPGLTGYNPSPQRAGFAPLHDTVDVSELQQRILELENRYAHLQRTSNETRSALQSKTGENAVLRQRMEKTTKEHEQKLSTMRQLHNEAQAKVRAELEATRREREKIATDNQFLRHDVAIEAGRVKQPRKVSGDGNQNLREAQLATPKKQRILPFRDGFDDGDIVLTSPSKVNDRSKSSTPKNANKRKRNVEDASPIRPLVVTSFDTVGSESPSRGRVVDNEAEPEILERLAKDQGQLRLMRRFLNHRFACGSDSDRVLEVLTMHQFPSDPSRKLSSLVFDRLIGRDFGQREHGLAGVICDALLDLWDQCLKETYYQPVNLLMDTMYFMLQGNSFDLSRALTLRLVPLCIATCDLVAIPVARESLKRKGAQNRGTHTASTDNITRPPDLDVENALELLYYAASACSRKPDAITAFWQLMKFDFVLLMMMRAQPLPQISLMLRLLRSSALSASFGAIHSSDQARQKSRENDTINRLTLLLSEKFEEEVIVEPEPVTLESMLRPSLPPPTAQAAGKNGAADPHASIYRELDLLDLRLEILSVFVALGGSEYGLQLLAGNKFALGRLVRHLHNSIMGLYTFSMATHDKLIQAVNTGMWIVYHIVTSSADSPSGPIDVKEKLRVVTGGLHIWLLALTRLAFMEGLLAEEGILPETSDMAHQLLDEYLSPDEGEQLLEVFSSGTSTR